MYVVAGGGNSAGEVMSSTETLQEGGLNWETGQELPRTLRWMASVSLDHTVLLIGIVYYHILHLYTNNNCRRRN